MTTILLAISDSILRSSCRSYLEAAAETVIEVGRPLALLHLARVIACDAVVVDQSELGSSATTVSREIWPGLPVVVLGPGSGRPTTGVELPLSAVELLDTLKARLPTSRPAVSPPLRLDPVGHRALIGESEVRLSGTEYLLLSMLLERRPLEVSIEEALSGLWGHDGVGRGPNALRVHVRNLRARLASAGLRNAVQSRRGRGYALVL